MEHLRHCVQELFEEQVDRTPGATAVYYQDQQMSYMELNCLANQAGRYLRRLGVGPEVLVGLCLDRSPELVVGLLGTMKAGGVYLPLDPAYPAERLRLMVKDAKLAIVITQERFKQRWEFFEGALVVL